ncbi:MAG: ABC transporter permease [Pedosphaera sp.]|nr:ABC transporter permease [Pedosphaera sp.]MSU42813.1 ABC transporter permease [Pedosphaera sp.]
MFFQDIGQAVLLFCRALRQWPAVWRERQKVWEQLHEIGNASLFMACLLAFFIGGVLALQTGPVMSDRGVSNFIGGMVGLAMCKELGPVMMAVLISGRIGSAMAAEIGSMQVYQEIDALRTMNIDPVRYLVLPRLVAIVVGLPLLVLFAVVVGWMGGALVCMSNPEINLTYNGYMNSLSNMVRVGDVANGLIKSIAFAVVIGVVSCHQGLNTIGGPRGVGRSVTKAVVNSIVMILMLDYVLTRLMIRL